MAFIVLAVILLALKLLDVAPVAAWSWWWVLAPNVAALVWWAYADGSGLTRRREMDKDQERKDDRRRRNIAAMGLGPKKEGKGGRR
jgi:small Trp-rich protein